MNIKKEWIDLVKEGRDDELRKAFIKRIPPSLPADKIYEASTREFSGEELAEICAEIILTITADCHQDEFHNWDYDHLTHIIELSKRFDFSIPRNLLNGLPEQLILLVDSDSLQSPECDD